MEKFNGESSELERKEAAAKLCQRLREAGFELSPDAIAKAST